MKRRHLIAAAGLVAAVVGGLTNLVDSGHADPVVVEASPQTRASIATLLDRVGVVDGMRKQPGYQRGCKKGQGCVFGPAWNDPSNSTGCDTRNRILRNQLANVEFKSGTRNCKVATGLLHDPYSGTDIAFSSRDDADAVQIDHVAPLGAVWNLGAWAWPLRQRQLFANDTDNLLAVSGPLNGGKSDGTISDWLPPNQKFVCRYIEIYLSVMVKYQLPITRADREAAERHCLSGG